jgi:hypothetical protein
MGYQEEASGLVEVNSMVSYKDLKEKWGGGVDATLRTERNWEAGYLLFPDYLKKKKRFV